MRVIFYGLGVACFVVIFAFLMQLLGFAHFAVFAPLYEQVRYSTYQQSASYNEGMIRDLENLQIQYVSTKDEGAKAALRAVVLHRFSVYPENRLPANLRKFYDEIRAAQ